MLKVNLAGKKMPGEGARKKRKTSVRRRLEKGNALLLNPRYRRLIGREFIRQGIDRWVAEERLGPEKAEKLRKDLYSEKLSDFLTHFGAHVAIFISGTFIRPAYTLGNRTVNRHRYLRGKIDFKRYSDVKALHNWEAMLVGAIPGLGRLAYPVSAFTRAPEIMHITLDQLAYTGGRKMQLYKKLRMGAGVDAAAKGITKYVEFKEEVKRKRAEKRAKKKEAKAGK